MHQAEGISYHINASSTNSFVHITDERILISILVVYCILIAYGIFGNIINIIFFIKQLAHQLSRQYQFFILFLSWFDLFSCAISLPLGLMKDFQHRFIAVTDPNWCSLLIFPYLFFPWVSANLLIFIAIEHFFAVVKPHTKISRKIWTIIIIIYLIFMSSITLAFSVNNLAVPNRYYCLAKGDNNPASSILIRIASCFTFSIIIGSASLYMIMFYTLKKKNAIQCFGNQTSEIGRQSGKNLANCNNNKLDKHRRNLIKNMIVCFYLVIFYIIITLPLITLSLCKSCPNPTLYHHIIYLNNIVNFGLYFVKLKVFRQFFFNIFKCSS